MLAVGLLWGCSSCRAAREAREPVVTKKPPPPKKKAPAIPLPRSSVKTSLETSSVHLTISTRQISAGPEAGKQEQAAAITAGKVDPAAKEHGEQGYLIKPLLDSLKKIAETNKGAKSPGATVAPVIWADQTTSFRVLSEVLYTVGMAGFSRFQLAARDGDDEPVAIRFTFPRIRAARATVLTAPGDHPRLNLTVAVTYRGFLVSVQGETQKGPGGELPTVKCKVELVKGRCPVWFSPSRGGGQWVERYDHAGLRALLQKIKKKWPEERKVIVMAANEIPYQVLVGTLDTTRGSSTDKCTGADGCLFDEPVLAAGVE